LLVVGVAEFTVMLVMEIMEPVVVGIGPLIVVEATVFVILGKIEFSSWLLPKELL